MANLRELRLSLDDVKHDFMFGKDFDEKKTRKRLIDRGVSPEAARDLVARWKTTLRSMDESTYEKIYRESLGE